MNGKYVTTIFISLLLFVNTFIFISLHNHDDNLQEDNIVFYSYDYDIYYQNVEFLSGEILHAELYETIRNHTVVSYNSVWEHLREVDEDPLNNANVDKDKQETVIEFLESLEDDDDVQNVFSNANFENN